MRKLVLLLVVVFIVIGCPMTPMEMFPIEVVKRMAMDSAQLEVVDIVSGSRRYVWNSTSSVVDSFPIYLDGIEGISYYECKVKTDGRDSGFVLVNVNYTDFPVVEAQEEGLTVSETFEGMTDISKEDLIVFRYSYTANAAFMKGDVNVSSLLSRDTGVAPIATIGFGTDVFDFDRYRDQVRAKGGSLFSTVESVPLNDVVLRGMSGRGDAEVHLKQRWDYPRQTAAMPPWNQYPLGAITNPKDPLYEPIGCTPIAIGLVYAYWHVKKGYDKLFRTDLLSVTDPNNRDEINAGFIRITSPESEFMTEIALLRINDLMSTTGGRTYHGKIWKAQNYARERGYADSTVTRRNGGYDRKFNMIYDSLAEDRPVVMSINHLGIGPVTHSIVVEHAKRQSVWGNSYIRYYCNFGGGSGWRDQDGKATPNKWIYAYAQRPVGETASGYSATRASTFDFWDINIR